MSLTISEERIYLQFMKPLNTHSAYLPLHYNLHYHPLMPRFFHCYMILLFLSSYVKWANLWLYYYSLNIIAHYTKLVISDVTFRYIIYHSKTESSNDSVSDDKKWDVWRENRQNEPEWCNQTSSHVNCIFLNFKRL